MFDLAYIIKIRMEKKIHHNSIKEKSKINIDKSLIPKLIIAALLVSTLSVWTLVISDFWKNKRMHSPKNSERIFTNANKLKSINNVMLVTEEWIKIKVATINYNNENNLVISSEGTTIIVDLKNKKVMWYLSKNTSKSNNKDWEDNRLYIDDEWIISIINLCINWDPVIKCKSELN